MKSWAKITSFEKGFTLGQLNLLSTYGWSIKGSNPTETRICGMVLHHHHHRLSSFAQPQLAIDRAGNTNDDFEAFVVSVQISCWWVHTWLRVLPTFRKQNSWRWWAEIAKFTYHLSAQEYGFRWIGKTEKQSPEGANGRWWVRKCWAFFQHRPSITIVFVRGLLMNEFAAGLYIPAQNA